MNRIIEQVKMNIKKAQEVQVKNYNPHHRSLIFKVNDQVLLDATNISIEKGPTAKLSDKYLGPFRIIKVISPVSYKLDLPAHYKIHLTFHISKLRPYKYSSSFLREQPDRPPPQITPSGELGYEVENIVNHRTIKVNKKLTKQYRVKWLNYDSSENTWEDAQRLKKQISLVVQQYESNR